MCMPPGLMIGTAKTPPGVSEVLSDWKTDIKAGSQHGDAECTQ